MAKKINNIDQLKKLMKDLGATEETTSDGFTFIELDSKNLKGWPKVWPKYKKEQATSEQAAGTGNKRKKYFRVGPAHMRVRQIVAGQFILLTWTD